MSRELPEPMFAVAAKELPIGDEWAYEMKWDGYRAIVEVARGSLRMATVIVFILA